MQASSMLLLLRLNWHSVMLSWHKTEVCKEADIAYDSSFEVHGLPARSFVIHLANKNQETNTVIMSTIVAGCQAHAAAESQK